MRTKCIDYIMAGLPIITTKKGIEGLDLLKAGDDYLVYDNVNIEFVKGIKTLFENKSLLQQFQQKIFNKSKLYNWQKFEKRFIRLYHKLINFND